MLKAEIVERVRSFMAGTDGETLKETATLVLDVLAGSKGEAEIEDGFAGELDFGSGGFGGIIEEVRKVAGAAQIKKLDFEQARASGLIQMIGHDVDQAFLEALDAVRMRRELAQKSGGDLKIVYTPLHGTGIRVVPKALERWG